MTGRLGEDGEVPVVGEEILVAVLVAADLGPAGEALGTQVKVRAVRTAHAQPVYLILHRGKRMLLKGPSQEIAFDVMYG